MRQDVIRRLVLSRTADVVGALAGRARAQTVLFNAFRLNRPEASRLRDQRSLRFLGYVLARRGWSRSQILQDLWVCFELGEQRGGYFVEFGATDGKTNSNTWLLEQQFGWRGLLLEPNPYWHSALAANRSAVIDHRCVAARGGESVDFVATDSTDPELSGIATYSQGELFDEARRRGQVIPVETVTLDQVLADHDAPPVIDYLSIDTEGSELDILRTFDLAAHRPRVMSVEHNAETEHEIERLLAGHGYRRVLPHLSQWDSWYVCAELADPDVAPEYVPRA